MQFLDWIKGNMIRMIIRSKTLKWMGNTERGKSEISDNLEIINANDDDGNDDIMIMIVMTTSMMVTVVVMIMKTIIRMMLIIIMTPIFYQNNIIISIMMHLVPHATLSIHLVTSQVKKSRKLYRLIDFPSPYSYWIQTGIKVLITITIQ